MKTSQRGINDLVLSEGLKISAYRDSVGVLTIGVGHTANAGSPVPTPGMRITRQQALDILATDLAKFEKGVIAVLGNVPQHVFDGAVSFHFNTGAIGRATWPRKYKAGDMTSARKSFMQWNKPPEIIGRRRREAELIFEGKYATGPWPKPATHDQPVFEPPILPKVTIGEGGVSGSGSRQPQPNRQPDDPGHVPSQPAPPAGFFNWLFRFLGWA